LTLGEQQYFCLGRRFSKHQMTRYAKNFGGHGPLAMLMFRTVAYMCTMITCSRQWCLFVSGLTQGWAINLARGPPWGSHL